MTEVFKSTCNELTAIIIWHVNNQFHAYIITHVYLITWEIRRKACVAWWC